MRLKSYITLLIVSCCISVYSQVTIEKSVDNKNYLLRASTHDHSKDDYLIITAPEFEADLTGFITFRKKRFNVSCVTTSQTGTSSQAIITFIKSVNPTPIYLLLVGDTEHIPPGDTTRANTDLNYADTEGDYYPEIFLGRFSVTTSSELANIVHKTIYMEENLHLIDKKNLFIGSSSSNAHIGPIKYFTNAGYTNVICNCDSIPDPKKKIIETLNSGVIFTVFEGPSSGYSWLTGGSNFSRSDIQNLTNTTSYPFAYSFSCLTGAFQSDTCLAEAFIRAKGGAVAAIGASISTAWTPDEKLEQGIFDAIFDDQNPQTSLCASLNAGKMSNSSSKETYFKAYNLFGDPALELLPFSTAVTTQDKKPLNSDLAFFNNRITFSVPETKGARQLVCINLYSMQGRLITRVVHENMAPGYYGLSIPPVSTGMYLCRTRIGNRLNTIRIVFSE